MIIQDVLDHTAQKSNIRPGTKGGVDMGLSGGLREPRINAHERCALFNGLSYPFERYGVIGGRDAAHE